MDKSQALDVVSQMVLDKIKTRPSLVARWGRLLEMLLEEYPECDPSGAEILFMDKDNA